MGRKRVIEILAPLALPRDVGTAIQYYLGWFHFRSDEWRLREKLRALFQAGARWMEASKEEVANVRASMLKLSDRAFEDILELLAEADNCSPEVRAELVRTPSIRKRMKAVGLFPPEQGDDHRYRQHGGRGALRLLSKYGIEPPKPPKPPPPPLPRTVGIGTRRPHGNKLTLTRSELFERVWSTPMMTLAAEWGLSDRGLAKACRRVRIPVPPRGYWARREAGQKVRRPPLPSLKEGQVEEMVIWLPE